MKSRGVFNYSTGFKFAPSKIRTCRLGLEIRSFLHLTDRGENVINNILPKHADDSVTRLEAARAVNRISHDDWMGVLRHRVFLAQELAGAFQGVEVGRALGKRAPAVLQALCLRLARNA